MRRLLSMHNLKDTSNMQPELPKEVGHLPVSRSSKICLGILFIWLLGIIFYAMFKGHDILGHLILFGTALPVTLLFMHLGTQKVDVSDDAIGVSSALVKRRQLVLSQIKYYRCFSSRGTTIISFIPRSKSDRKIAFYLSSLSKNDRAKVMAFARKAPDFMNSEEYDKEQKQIGIVIASMWFTIIIGAAALALYVNWPHK